MLLEANQLKLLYTSYLIPPLRVPIYALSEKYWRSHMVLTLLFHLRSSGGKLLVSRCQSVSPSPDHRTEIDTLICTLGENDTNKVAYKFVNWG
jgi:hypothetical protein